MPPTIAPISNGYGFSTCRDIYGNGLRNIPDTENLGFVGFVQKMETYAQTWFSKKGAWNQPLWLPCQFDVCPDTRKMRCLNELAQPTHIFGLDFDDAGNTIAGVKTALDALGCDYYMHTSMSYQPGQHEKCRAVIHTNHLIMDNDDNKLTFSALNCFFTKNGLILDKACSNIARKFYVPGSNKQTSVKCHAHFELERGALDMTTMLEKERKILHRQQIASQVSQNLRAIKYSTASQKNGKKQPQNPYFNSYNDHNIADKKRVAAFMALSSRGSEMAEMAAHIVGYCAVRFGPNVVSSVMMEQALRAWAGNTSHNNFTKSITDARLYLSA